MSIKRIRGDNYPITVTLKLNKVALDLTGSTITFSYVKGKEAPKSIVGTIDNALEGKVSFFPTATDFQVAGTYAYDIKHSKNGIITTYISDELILSDSVTR